MTESTHVPESISRIAVQLAVELGRIRMTLDELMMINEESVLDLGRAADAPVTLTVNDVPIARGEILVIDGELSVRILEVLEHGVAA